MTEEKTLETIQKIFSIIFTKDVSFSLEEILEKFAFDVKLPKKVTDSTTGEITWADSIHSGKFITLKNMEEKDRKEGWMLEKREFSTLQEVLDSWDLINLTTTERVYDSTLVSCSDTIYRCQNIYRSTDCSDSNHLVFCDSCGFSSFLLASSRSGSCNFCIHVTDSKDCSNSYHVICSNKISNSFFIQDCFNLDECMFCSHIANKKYCISNIQFEKEEYIQIREAIIEWILSS